MALKPIKKSKPDHSKIIQPILDYGHIIDFTELFDMVYIICERSVQWKGGGPDFLGEATKLAGPLGGRVDQIIHALKGSRPNYLGPREDRLNFLDPRGR